ncbi:MAG: Hsp33 family molecular chaperone HslO [Neisseriaceae bacterium]|nr:Hsp33 family molecular chaperone HslO [Neisseriaceae bacterium]
MNNQRIRFLFDDMPVRGLHMRVQEVWQHIVSRKHYPLAIRRALGELLAAGALLSSNLKIDGTLILQVQGQGILKMLVVEATSDNTLRAVARWDENANVADDADLVHLLGENGIFAITLQPKEGEQWQGIVPLEGKNIAQMLMNYMERSEQLQTHIALAANDETVSGLLLQKLPEKELDENAWQHVKTLAQTIDSSELLQLDAEHLLYRLYHETPPRIFPAEHLEFACTCSRGKVSDMLLMLGAEEVGKVIAEEGSVTINCDFCNERYTFDETDINTLFGVDILALSKQQSVPLQ